MPGMASGNGTLQSFSAAAPANADALAAAHHPYDASLPPLQPGNVVPVHIVMTVRTVQIAPGIKYSAWAWAKGAPGLVPAGGGGIFDVKIDRPGLYPFVSHAFAAVDQGQVGLLNVGHVEGTMSH
jgi:hypothetical protein